MYRQYQFTKPEKLQSKCGGEGVEWNGICRNNSLKQKFPKTWLKKLQIKETKKEPPKDKPREICVIIHYN